jgi:hypothetical protein
VRILRRALRQHPVLLGVEAHLDAVDHAVGSINGYGFNEDEITVSHHRPLYRTNDLEARLIGN